MSEAKINWRTYNGNRRDIPEYGIWKSIRKRCNNHRRGDYALYGGRGITYCLGFDHFWYFYETIGPRPSAQHSVDRVDVDGNYSCGTCPDCLRRGWTMNVRWATHKQQANNRRSSRTITHEGESKTLQQWSDENELHHTVILGRLRRGWSKGDALNTPSVQGRNQHGVNHPTYQYKGESYTLAELQPFSVVGKSALWKRLKLGWDVEDALTRPVRQT